MEQATMTAVTIAASILCWLVNLLLAAAVWNFKREVKKIDEIDSEVDSVKHNYLSRFDDLKSSMLEQIIPIKEDLAVVKARLEYMSEYKLKGE
jgi:hypothetical protein